MAHRMNYALKASSKENRKVNRDFEKKVII